MFEKIKSFCFSSEKVYGLNLSKELVEINKHLFLNVKLAHRNVYLPLVNLVSAPFAIAWFDPNHDRNPLLTDVAAMAMSQILIKLDPTVVFTPPSSKSGEFISKAVYMTLGKTDKLFDFHELIGSQDKKKTKNESLNGNIIDYVPVTGLKKFMGLPKTDYNSADIDKTITVFADDVYTTGATIEAMKRLTGIYDPFIAVIAREATLDKNFPPKMLPNIKAAIIIPEIPISMLDRNKLFSIEDRASIARAVVR